jgi:hypothetical protein
MINLSNYYKTIKKKNYEKSDWWKTLQHGNRSKN